MKGKDNMMWGTVVLGVTRVLYNHGLRDIIKKLVDDPDEQWDEFMLELFDLLLGVKK
jgi:hypothetical protein